MTASRLAAIGAGIFCLCVIAGVVRPGTPSSVSNVVIVTLDTTRADRLPPYGYQSASMPAIERLAGEGLVFLQAFTVAPLTLPAHCSLMTGRYPPHHNVRDNGDPPLDPSHATLAETLHGRGFRTGAFVAADVLARDRGLARGFEVYRDPATAHGDAPSIREPANEVVNKALSWLSASGDSPFFVWVHLYDAHAPYSPPEPFRSRFPTDPYEGSLAFMDTQVDRLIQWLGTHQQLARTLIVVAGDHGESLGDHGELEHGLFIYDSVLHIPLMMRGPGIPARRFVPVTSLVDVMPTILGLLRIPSTTTDGRDLTPAMLRGTDVPEAVVYSESMYPQRFGVSPERAVRVGGKKFIEAPRPELYDLLTDPLEEHNEYQAGSPMAYALAAVLDTFGGVRPSPGAPTNGTVPDRERQERLAALGYIAGDPGRPATPGLDPKDYIAAYNATRWAGRTHPR
jgi:choline-sulfatase